MAIHKISVVMSVYNGQEYLAESIESILSQTYGNYEFIIVDDASTDQSLQIIEKYAKQDKRIKVISNETNLKLTKSLIKAINSSNGPFISRQDADDISKLERFEKQIKYLISNPECGALGTSAQIIDRTGNMIKDSFVPKSWPFIKKLLWYGNCFIHGSMMFRRQSYEHAGGYREALSLSQDYDLWLRMSNVTKMNNLEDKLYLLRMTDENVSKTKSDTQLKMGALAMYEYRYNRNLVFDGDFEINRFISSFTKEEKKRYFKCLKVLCLRHGHLKMIDQYKLTETLSDKFLYYLIFAAKKYIT